MYKRIPDNRRHFRPRLFARLPVFTFLVLLLLPTRASLCFADEIYFKSGYSQRGVVTRETDDSISFRTEMGMSTVSRERIDFIEKDAPEENRRLLKEWKEKIQLRKAEAEAQREAERKFEQEQIAKGLLKFEKKWMTPTEKAQLLDLRKRALEHRRAFEAEQRAKGLVQFEHIWVTPELAEELTEMEPEIYRLNDEILGQEELVDSFRSAMLNVNSVEDAENFSERIEEATESMNENIEKLNKLLRRADQVEAMGVTYEMPEEFLDAFPPEESEEETELE